MAGQHVERIRAAVHRHRQHRDAMTAESTRLKAERAALAQLQSQPRQNRPFEALNAISGGDTPTGVNGNGQ